MRSSDGDHFLAIDHLRALAAFMVFSWHFLHGFSGYPLSFDYFSYFFFLSIFNEGHTGVSLFMVLSGYLFSFLTRSLNINYKLFFYNRILRLFPLLIFVFLMQILIIFFDKGLEWNGWHGYLINFIYGFVFPLWPQGAWSITVELHFYLLLPLFVFLVRRNIFYIFFIVILFVFIRYLIFLKIGEAQTVSYLTLIGRIDQFMFGMISWNLRKYYVGNGKFVFLIALLFLLFYSFFDFSGGFYKMPSYPSSSALWIFMPSIEGVAYAIFVGWYVEKFSRLDKDGFFNKLISNVGQLSYSMYLIHFFFVFDLANFINRKILPINDLFTGLVFSLISFFIILPICWITFNFIEKPFLKLRKSYIK